MKKTKSSPKWKAKPKVELKVTGESDDPAKAEPSGARSGEHLNRQLSRTVYRNRLVDQLTGVCDEIGMNTFHTLNLTFLHLKDQIYGLTIGQLEELLYAITLLAQLQHQLSRQESTLAAKRHQDLLRKLRKGLTLE